MPSQQQVTQLQGLFEHAYNATKGSGLFPETLLTQRIHESGWDPKSPLVTVHHNYFGIKADSAWTGKVVSITTHENVNGRSVKYLGTGLTYPNRSTAIAKGANAITLFRSYPDIQSGFRGWVDFLKKNPRYTNAGVFTAKNAVEQFKALAKAGYATDPLYYQKLVTLYNGLHSHFTAFRSWLAKKKLNPVTAVRDGGSYVFESLRFFFTGN